MNTNSSTLYHYVARKDLRFLFLFCRENRWEYKLKQVHVAIMIRVVYKPNIVVHLRYAVVSFIKVYISLSMGFFSESTIISSLCRFVYRALGESPDRTYVLHHVLSHSKPSRVITTSSLARESMTSTEFHNEIFYYYCSLLLYVAQTKSTNKPPRMCK